MALEFNQAAALIRDQAAARFGRAVQVTAGSTAELLDLVFGRAGYSLRLRSLSCGRSKASCHGLAKLLHSLKQARSDVNRKRAAATAHGTLLG